jgi:cytochrome c-type biogenesis protein CcsB
LEINGGDEMKLNKQDIIFAIFLIAGICAAWYQLGYLMDVYDKLVLVSAAPVLFFLGRLWSPIRWLVLGSAALVGLAIFAYQGNLALAEKSFLLKYFFSSQSAILWMGVLFLFSTIAYWMGFFARSNSVMRLGSGFCWVAVVMGLVGMFVRWHESYLIGLDVGYIPISNLYEVFILFCWMTALFYLYYEAQYKTYQLGAFVLTVILAAVGFLFWYTVARDAANILPLVPALQSWWMKIHVPANFVGYGTFSLAAMVGVAYLCKAHGYGVSRLPSLEGLDDVMYKAISIGFAFFTVATILGALWAAEAWGGYWSWDPKETWALIVWLNYAAWLHMRLMKGLRGRVAAWWALIGLLITTFAFLGVNIFLSGLHSYGTL